MTPPDFDNSDDNKRRFAAALCKFVGQPWEAAVHVFGKENTGVVLYVANTWTADHVVVQEQQRLLSADEVAKSLPGKAEAARAVWEWTKDAKAPMKDRIAAMELYAELQEFIAKEAPPSLPQVPPQIIYELDPDAGTAPNPSVSAAA